MQPRCRDDLPSKPTTTTAIVKKTSCLSSVNLNRLAFGGDGEVDLVDRLYSAGAVIVSLVAIKDDGPGTGEIDCCVYRRP
jgi:hypothetical protein